MTVLCIVGLNYTRTEKITFVLELFLHEQQGAVTVCSAPSSILVITVMLVPSCLRRDGKPKPPLMTRDRPQIVLSPSVHAQNM